MSITATSPSAQHNFRILMWAATLLIVVVLGFLYVGSSHRDRCLKAGNVGCSMLPWSGHPPARSGWGPSHYLLP